MAAPEPVLQRLGEVAAHTIPIGSSGRQAPVFGRPEEAWDESIREEVRLIGDLCASGRF